MNSEHKTCVVDLEALSRHLRWQLSHAATLESIMEVMRIWLEKGDPPLMNLWVSHFYALQHQPADILKLPAKTHLAEIQSAFLDQLQSSLSVLDEANTEFRRAYDEGKQALLVRWLEEWRVRKANLEQLVE